MKQFIKVNRKPVLIEVYVCVFDKTGFDIDDFDTLVEAKASYDSHVYSFRWEAAKVIDIDGNLDFPVSGFSKFDAIKNLKKVLS